MDTQKVLLFSQSYNPNCDMVLVQIDWNNLGGFYYIPLEVQKTTMNDLTREKYIKLPKQGTNPRGVEIQSFAMRSLVENKKTYKIPINWQKEEMEFDPFKRWVEYWEMD